MFACLELAQLQSVIYQYFEINLRAALSAGGGRQLPIYGVHKTINYTKDGSIPTDHLFNATVQ